MLEYKRLPDESDFDYGMRLITTKIELNPDNLDWQDIVELLGLDIHRDTLRKSSQGDFGGYNVYKTMLENMENSIDDNEILERIRKEKEEFEKEKKRFQDQRREYNKIRAHEARYEHLKDEFIKVIKESDDVELDFDKRDDNSFSNKHGVLLLSDWHVGLKTENYWNEYNINEFYNRIEKLVNKTIEYGRFHNIDTLHVFGLGDFVHGLIHISTRVASEEDVVHQTKRVSETLLKMLIEFASEFNQVEFYTVTGNHGRVSPRKQDSIEKENFEEFIMWYLEGKLDDKEKFDNIGLNKNTYDEGIIVADVLGHTCLGVHGDKDKISNVTQNLALMLKTIPEYVFTADKHHLEENEIHGVEVVINRSLSGVDEYAKNIRKTSYAGQSFMIFDKEAGRECTYNIKLN